MDEGPNPRPTEEPLLLESVDPGLSGLVRAQALRDRAAEVGFDWAEAARVFDKLDEELRELQMARGTAEQREELGDLLFVLVNLAHHLGFTAEAAIQEANEKFVRRFNAIELACRRAGTRPETLSLEQLDALWDEAKRAERESAR